MTIITVDRTACALDRPERITRSLLGYGVLAGPFYVVVSIIEGLTRDGFELRRHALSLLASGPWGWVHSLTLAATGAMTVAAAVGLARRLRTDGTGTGRTWLPRLVAGFGLGMIAAGAFASDPMDGFLGTPPGPPTDPTLHGTLHMFAASTAFACAVAATLVLARRFRQQGRRAAVGLCAGTAAVAVAGMASTTIIGVWTAMLVTFAWLAITSVRAYRTTTL